jgi:uncharacterized protein
MYIVGILASAIAFAGVQQISLPAPNGFVNDHSLIIAPEETAQLEKKLKLFKEQTSTEIAVVTVQSLEGMNIEQYAGELFKKYRLGETTKNNGVLVLVAPHEKKARIEVGYGLEGVLPDILAKQILNDVMMPHFAKNDFNTGILQGTDHIIAAVRYEHAPTVPSQLKLYTSTLSKKILDFMFRIVVSGGGPFIFIFTWIMFRRNKSWWEGGLIGALIGSIAYAYLQDILGIVVGLGIFSACLLLDYTASHDSKDRILKFILTSRRARPGRGSSTGGSFGGFGGGRSGGGGASGSW